MHFGLVATKQTVLRSYLSWWRKPHPLFPFGANFIYLPEDGVVVISTPHLKSVARCLPLSKMPLYAIGISKQGHAIITTFLHDSLSGITSANHCLKSSQKFYLESLHTNKLGTASRVAVKANVLMNDDFFSSQDFSNTVVVKWRQQFFSQYITPAR